MEEKELKNIIDKKVNQFLTEEVKNRENLICEMWSYNDKMDDMIDYIYDALIQNINKSELHRINNSAVLRHGFIYGLSIFGTKGITFEYYIYECENDDVYLKIIKNAYSQLPTTEVRGLAKGD